MNRTPLELVRLFPKGLKKDTKAQRSKEKNKENIKNLRHVLVYSI